MMIRNTYSPKFKEYSEIIKNLTSQIIISTKSESENRESTERDDVINCMVTRDS